MKTVEVSLWINAPIETVFEAVSDHGAYGKFQEIQQAELLQPGTTEKNGKGAIRKLVVTGFTLVEEVSRFERPHCFEYQIVDFFVQIGPLPLHLPLHHELGRVEFKRNQGGTDVHWISIVDMRIPILGPLMTHQIVRQSNQGFFSMLEQLRDELEGPLP